MKILLVDTTADLGRVPLPAQLKVIRAAVVNALVMQPLLAVQMLKEDGFSIVAGRLVNAVLVIMAGRTVALLAVATLIGKEKTAKQALSVVKTGVVIQKTLCCAIILLLFNIYES